MYKSIMVTGGCGFIGSNFVEYLSKQSPKTKVVVVDSLTYAGSLDNLCGLYNYDFFHADICDTNAMRKIIKDEKIEVIVNFAAESHVDNSILSSKEFVRTNVMGTENLLSLALNEGVKRFLQVSTDEVYGSLGPEAPPSKETDILDPSSPYSASKAAADHLVMSYHKTHKLDTIITRCSNNYGPRQNHEKLVPLMIEKAIAEEPLPVYGNGSNIRDWIHVADHCDGIYLALTGGTSGEIYNFGGRNQTTNLALVTRIIHSLNKCVKLIEFVEDRKGHDFRYDIDCSKAQRELGWHPQVEIGDGFNRTIAWYKNNSK